MSESGVFGEGFCDGAGGAWIERGGKGSHQLRFTRMMVCLDMYLLRNERSSVHAAPLKKRWELNRQPAMKEVTVIMETARKIEMYFHNFDPSNSRPAGEGVPFPVSSSSSSRSLFWRRWDFSMVLCCQWD